MDEAGDKEIIEMVTRVLSRYDLTGYDDGTVARALVKAIREWHENPKLSERRVFDCGPFGIMVVE